MKPFILILFISGMVACASTAPVMQRQPPQAPSVSEDLVDQQSSLKNLCYVEKVEGSCFTYGRYLEKRGEKVQLVIDVYRQACEDGDSHGCEAAGRLRAGRR